MSILVDSTTRVLVQNITGREGRYHTDLMLRYGTKIVAGTAPGRQGQDVGGVPVFESVRDAVAETSAEASVVFVPAALATDAIVEAVDAGIPLIVCVTEGIPALDTLKLHAHAQRKGSRLLGPNCPGLIVPGRCKLGIIPGSVCTPGPVGVVSRSGTLTYEIAAELTARKVGQSICVGIGGDPIVGTSFVDVLRMFEADPETQVIAIIGEIGGTDEEEAAAFVQRAVTKPVVGFVAGKTAPPEKQMGHAGAIISRGRGAAADKIAALEQAGVVVASTTEEMAELIEDVVRH